MPFREKSAWISLVCLVLTFGHFFLGLLVFHARAKGFHTFVHFFVVVIAYIVLQIVLHVIAAALAPKDAKAPPDERERLILLKAGRNAHALLLACVLVLPLGLHMGWSGGEMGYALILVIVVSEAVRAVSQIVYYRRGG